MHSLDTVQIIRPWEKLLSLTAEIYCLCQLDTC
jgi:hypothetical protein